MSATQEFEASLDQKEIQPGRLHIVVRGARLVDRLIKLIRLVGDAAVLAVICGDVVLVAISVFYRDALHHSLLFTNELSEWCLVFMAFVGGAQAYARGSMPAIHALVDRLPLRTRPLTDTAVLWFTVLLSTWMALGTVPLIHQGWKTANVFPSLKWADAWQEIPILAGSILLGIYATHTALRRPIDRILLVRVAAICIAVACPFIFEDALFGLVPSRTASILTFIVLFTSLAVGTPLAVGLALSPFLFFSLSGQAPASIDVTDVVVGINQFILLTVPFFILAGLIMAGGEISQRVVDFTAALVGRVRGGLLHVCIVSMYIFSGMSGSKAGDIAAVGSGLTSRLAARGYKREECAAILAASAAMGETIPPSIAILVFAAMSSLSVGTLFIAGILPAAFLAVCLMILVWLRARTHQFTRGDKFSVRALVVATRRALLSLTVPVVLFVAIFGGITTETEGSALVVIYALLVTLRYGIRPGVLRWIGGQAVGLIGMVMFLVGAGKAFSFFVTFTGIPHFLTDHLSSLPGGKFSFVVATILMLIVLGSIFEGLPALIILTPLLLPIAQDAGMDPIHYGILLIVALGIGAFTPPLGVGVYVATAVSGATMEKTAKPLGFYLIGLFAGALAIGFIPWITLVLPRLTGHL
jgi:tripartite ATP-independent transporter DctM subunit